KRPMRACLGGNGVGAVAVAGFSRSGIRCSHFYPCFEISNLFLRKFAPFRRHLKILVGIADGFDQQAFSGITGNDCRAGIAALENALLCVQKQTAFDLFRVATVARVAMIHEYRPDFFLEEFVTVILWRLSSGDERPA